MLGWTDLGVNPKIGGKPPKWMVYFMENMENPMLRVLPVVTRLWGILIFNLSDLFRGCSHVTSIWVIKRSRMEEAGMLMFLNFFLGGIMFLMEFYFGEPKSSPFV